MIYYIPIKIDGRRLHYFKLENASIKQPSPLFSFLVNINGNSPLLSIDADEPQMITSEGNIDSNISLDEHRFRVEKSTTGSLEGLPAYRIKIESGRTLPDVDNKEFLKSYGYTGADVDHKAVVKVDPTQAYKNNFREFALILSYTNEKDEVYEDAVKICLYSEEEEVISAALDFGSEASQIRYDRSDSNANVIDTMLSFGNNPNSDVEYWQGKRGDNLYKSVFFINMNPDETLYAEKPKVDDKKAFVQPLLSSSTQRQDYQSLELLPNLKLVEIGKNFMELSSRRIQFPGKPKIAVGTPPSLSSSESRESILRIILSNFLHCMLKDIEDGDKYLRMVLMVPNVYYQSKIYKLVHDLYEDFATIQKSGDYPRCKGIEVQVVSESDAAFLGVRHVRKDLKNASNGYFLIVDAGKGTTDYSILQQHVKFTEFSSLYRDGIPASGNVLTYAFHEAFCAFMEKHNIDLSKLMTTTNVQNSELLKYMWYLEQFKINYGSTQGECLAPKSAEIKDMTGVLLYMMRQVEQRHVIPGCRYYVDRKVDTLCQCLEKSLKNYIGRKKTKFIQVLLTGRGFLFSPFKNAVVEMLIKNEWIEDDSSVLHVVGNEAKTICLVGALAIEKECSVNHNSGLIGSPLIRRTVEDGPFRSFWGNLFNAKRIREVDIDFFYHGSSRIYAQNVDIVIGGRKYSKSANEKQKQALFYTGEGFLLKNEENESKKLIEHSFSFSDGNIGNLVMESLFPFYRGSMGTYITRQEQSHTNNSESPQDESTILIIPKDIKEEETETSPVSILPDAERVKNIDENVDA